MSIEILNLIGRRFSDTESGNVIDAAFPVLAYECEVSIPADKDTDAYEEVILKLLSIGVSEKSIQKTLNITESLCGSILASLEVREYIEQIAKIYKLTQKAVDVLKDIAVDDTDEKTKFGYIFVSAIKKEPLWYFHEGDIFNIQRSDAELLESKITKGKNEAKTFEDFDIPVWQIEKKFSTYCRIVKMMENLEKNGKSSVSAEKVAVLFADIESDLSESDYQDDDDKKDNSAKKSSISSKKSKVRKLKRNPKKLYLQMRIRFDPSVPGGFTVESPFDFRGNDNELFFRQIQWMNNQKEIFIGEDNFQQFMEKEINKFPIKTNDASIDIGLIIRKQLPFLNAEDGRYKQIYDDTTYIIHLMQQKNLSTIAKENIVRSFSKNLTECLMNLLCNTVSEEIRLKTNKQAFFDFIYKGNDMADKFAKIIKVERNILPSEEKIFVAIKRLKYTFGNSIYEKLLNLIVLQFYQPSQQIRRFFQSEGIEEYIKTVEKLNNIRNSASHAQGKPFTEKDYEYYTDNVFYVANRLLEALSIKEDE